MRSLKMSELSAKELLVVSGGTGDGVDDSAEHPGALKQLFAAVGAVIIVTVGLFAFWHCSKCCSKFSNDQVTYG